MGGTRQSEITRSADVELADRLISIMRDYRCVAVAFSGGVDSTVVAKAAQLALGDHSLAITARSPSLASGEIENAVELARQIGIRHVVIETNEFDNPAYVRNDGTRCYYCKSELYDRVDELADQYKFEVVCSGANTDDAGDYRPGLRAAAEHRVRHPLQEAGLGKAEVRRLAAFWGLPNSDKPASPCLSSRVAIGLEATPERVRRVDQAEQFLRLLGFPIARVRYHADDLARIEVPIESLSRFSDRTVRDQVAAEFKRLGFKFVSLDLEGFRSGSLNVLVPAEMLVRSNG